MTPSALLSGLLALIALTALGLGLVAMIRPIPRLKLPTRRRGGLLFVGGWVLAFIATTLFPASPPPEISGVGSSAGSSATPAPSVAGRPETIAFLAVHREYGSIKSATAMPDWQRGPREQVYTTRGAYLFYIENGEVVTVYQNDGVRKELWRKSSQGNR